jgi:hypothetical protein
MGHECFGLFYFFNILIKLKILPWGQKNLAILRFWWLFTFLFYNNNNNKKVVIVTWNNSTSKRFMFISMKKKTNNYDWKISHNIEKPT